MEKLQESGKNPMGESGRKLKILILLQFHNLRINAVRDYVEAFDLFSRHSVSYAHGLLPGWPASGKIDYDKFDVLLIPHHCRVLAGDESFNFEVGEAIKNFSGYKVLILQDEYDRTELARQWILNYGINHVFTIIADEDVEKVYDPKRFKGVTFTNFLTGYIPPSLDNATSIRPMSERPFHIAYRCREQGSWRGELCYQKLDIAKVVKRVCAEKRIPVDIEWAENKLIFGPAWYDFLQSGRATLGSESGSNVFDLDGSITKNVRKALQENPEMGYEDLLGKYFEDENIGVRTNQISPKFFEFIASKTALVLFEGNYSGILKPGIHYIPLSRDYSNLAEVLELLEDIPFLEAMAERAYSDVVLSGKYHYRAAIGKMDELIEREVERKLSPRQSERGKAGYSGLSEDVPFPIDILRRYEVSRREETVLLRESVCSLRAKKKDFSGMNLRREQKITKLREKLNKGS
ncbi:MAG: hypothetical protein QM496_01015 [Verrucomicrobiota bacterium]